ncbi:hypothetical protein M2G69_13470 [Vibrio vulnificus]|nr:hypothetical protein [Vibrio vulnificus]
MENLAELVCRFRRAMDSLNPTDFDGTSLSASKFPSACCDDSSQILAAYLSDNGCKGATLIRGEYGGRDGELQSHVWLNFNGLHIDITADQFNEYGFSNPPVIISGDSNFLSTFDTQDDGIADFRVHLKKYSQPSLEREFESCYQVVLRQLSVQA